MLLEEKQNLNNYIQSEQLKNNGRKPESSKSIRSLYRAGLSCLRIPALLTAGFLLSGCIGETIGTLGPIQFKQSDLVTTPAKLYKLQKQKEEKTNE